MRLITQQAEERWEASDGAIHIYSPAVAKWARNPLGYYFSSITVPDKPSEFSYLFQNRLSAAAAQEFHPQAGYGLVTSGIMSTELDGPNAHCVAGTYAHVNARQLLLREIVPARLIIIMLFPEENSPYSAAAWSFVEENSFWLSVDGPEQRLPLQLSSDRPN